MLWKVSRHLLFWPISLWIFLSDCILINHTYFCPHMVSFSICEYSINKSEKVITRDLILFRKMSMPCNLHKILRQSEELNLTWQHGKSHQHKTMVNKTRGLKVTWQTKDEEAGGVLANTHLHKMNWIMRCRSRLFPQLEASGEAQSVATPGCWTVSPISTFPGPPIRYYGVWCPLVAMLLRGNCINRNWSLIP